MNKLISIISAVTFCGLFTGCQKYLDLEPSQNISDKIALTSDDNVKHVLLELPTHFLQEYICRKVTMQMQEMLQMLL
jgi:hypothetical protein